jgi:hypothetical protein
MESMEIVFRELHAGGVRFVVIGGVALLLHGVVRLTLDLGLVIIPAEDNLRSFLKVMQKLGMRPRVPVDPTDLLKPDIVDRWRHEKGMKAFTFINPKEPTDDIDILIDEIIPFDEIARDAVVFDISGIPVNVISIPHLKRMKMIAGRPQDLADLESLSELEKMKDDEK